MDQNELEKACFQHDMAYGDFKGLTRKAVSDKILCDKEFNIAKNLKYDGYQRRLASMVYKIFNKKLLGKQLKKRISLIKDYQKNYTNQLSENSFIEKHLLKIIFEILVLLICN